MPIDLVPELTPLNVSIFLTLILLEGALSLDNAAVLAALTRRLPIEQRRKALLYGLVGAYVFRVLAILLAVVILQNLWLKVLGGAYLLYLTGRHFVSHHQDPFNKEPPKFPGLSVFWSTVVFIELADVAFALDQILVAVAFTEEVGVIILAALTAILLLRVFAFYMARLMDWFPGLEHVAYVAVGYVGLKLIAQYFWPDLVEAYLPKSVSVTITLLIFAVPLAWRLLQGRRGPTGITEEGGPAVEPRPGED